MIIVYSFQAYNQHFSEILFVENDKINVGNNLTIPHVETGLRIGCGACEFVFSIIPEKAIIVRGLKKHGIAEIASNEQAVDYPKGQNLPF